MIDTLIHLIAVPYDSGRRGERMGAGPLRLLDAGVVARLEESGHAARVTVVETTPGLWHGEIAAAFNLARQIAGLVRDSIAASTFPLVLSGNCGPAALGCVAGAGGTPRVFWFDAHGDFNTPETTIGGFLDGMALATLTGRCWRQLASAIDGFHPVPEHAVTLIGARDLDPLEAQALDRSGIRALREKVASGIDALFADDGRSPSYVHVDLDVLDPSEGRVNSYAAPRGLTLAEVREALGAIGRHTRIAAASLTALDPGLDASGRALEAALTACVHIAAAAHAG